MNTLDNFDGLFIYKYVYLTYIQVYNIVTRWYQIELPNEMFRERLRLQIAPCQSTFHDW